MNGRSFAAWLVLAALEALGASGPPDERMQAAWKAQSQGDCVRAAALYEEVLAQEARHTVARHLLGVCQLQMGQVAAGAANLERVVREEPRNRQALYTLISTYVATSRLEEAKEKIDRQLKLDGSAEAAFMRGSYWMAQGDYDSAIRHLERARKLSPKLRGLRSMLGVTYGFASRSDQAIAMLEAALRENPADGNAKAFLGWLYKERDRTGEAATLLEETVRERPGDYGALFLLAQLTQARGQAAEAVAMLEKVVAAQAEHRGAHVLLARLYGQLQRPEDAARERRIIAELNAAQQAAQPGSGARAQ